MDGPEAEMGHDGCRDIPRDQRLIVCASYSA
jgi:hypothetical protein